MSEVREGDFSSMANVKKTVRTAYDFAIRDNKLGLFIVVNVLLYGLVVGLGILRLFGVV